MAAKPKPLNAGTVTRLPTTRELDPNQTAKRVLDAMLARITDKPVQTTKQKPPKIKLQPR